MATAAIGAGVGLVLGAIFGALRVPCPAPPTIGGVMAVAAISFGYWLGVLVFKR